MSLTESHVEKMGYIGTEYSSGDSNKVKCKQFYQEENNNEINELSKEFSEMGCIVDAVKKPPNICVETCVYEEHESDNDNDNDRIQNDDENDEAHYSDEFEEEDISEIELEDNKKEVPNSNATSKIHVRAPPKLAKSQSSISSQKPPSVSGRSSDYGSVSVPPTRRINMSFTNERLREIERHNHILLNKILSARNNKKSSIPSRDQPKRPLPAAAVHRKMQQRKIEHDNMILLKRSSAPSRQRAASAVDTRDASERGRGLLAIY